ncbi:MAG: LPXTG cell wall anchor domain-containing protein [Ilumatobacteraceae bacterium]
MLLGAADTAAAAPAGTPTLTQQPSTQSPATRFEAELVGCVHDEPVQFMIGDGTSLRVQCGDGSPAGTAIASLVAGARFGRYAVTATPLESRPLPITAQLTLELTPPQPDLGEPLPSTGAGDGALPWLAAGALIAGLSLTGLARRRRRSPA